ncbi:MAG: hypothetical protein PWP28_2542 [Oceanotoga sp.]|uniref:glycosyltransferase n=1 Tax=Oceanotoga sp. TaxID=2108366 RepID=UPI00264D8F55|nr:glycosyltransferase [Oceanotoga sp.]MDN5343662.1 hypothetical protein [Oceanotoga sp.]
MNINYITIKSFKDVEGINSKINSQVKTFINQNYKIKRLYSNKKIFFSKLMDIENKMKKINNCEIIYIRDLGVMNLFLFHIFKKLKKRKNILILEMPTPLRAVYRETLNSNENYIKKKLKLLSYNILEKNLFDYFHIIVEYAPEKNRILDKYKNKIIMINNGLDLSSIRIKEKNKDNKKLNILSIANNSKWHGYDRVIKGMYEYYKKNPKKDVYYHCVGEGSELQNLKNLVKELKLEKYVIFHGTKTGEELDEIVDDSDIAFGSLANHRKAMYVDSALKNREYCARGIPFVIASDDSDFPESFPYVYRISQDETPVNIEKVIKFYDSIKNKNYIEEMRKYAEKNLTWDIKMRPVIERIKELANEKREPNK